MYSEITIMVRLMQCRNFSKGRKENDLLAKKNYRFQIYEEQGKGIGIYFFIRHPPYHCLHHRKYMKYADLSVFDWEQRKLSELSEKTFGGGTPKNVK